MLRHVDRAYCLSVYNARKTQTITITTTMVPNSPYPNIVASSGFLGFRIPMNHFGTVGLAMYVRFGTQFEQFVGYRRLASKV